MSQIIRATFSPVVPGQGNTRKVARSGRRYMSDSSMRTKPSIDDPSNMILPSSASSNCRSGISTFLIVPRMSVNCRRMNLTFSRSVRSRICALVSFAGVFAIQEGILTVERLHDATTVTTKTRMVTKKKIFRAFVVNVCSWLILRGGFRFDDLGGRGDRCREDACEVGRKDGGERLDAFRRFAAAAD